VTESFCVIIQFIFFHQTLFSGLISTRLRHFAKNSKVLAGLLVFEMRALPLSVVHQIGGCVGQNWFDLPEKRTKSSPDAHT